MDNYQFINSLKEYLQSKKKYIEKINIQYSGGYQEYNEKIKQEWLSLYPDFYNHILLNLINNPISDILPYLISPKSVRGADLIELLQPIYKHIQDWKVSSPNLPTILYDNFNFIYNNWHGIDNDRIDLLILTLKCMLFVENPNDEKSHLEVGIGDLDPYISSTLDKVPTVNKILSKYPYTKALCPFGRDCPYWNSHQFKYFKQPYQYFTTSDSRFMDNNSILLAADIIKENNNEIVLNKVKAHFHLWSHLPPSAFDFESIMDKDIKDYYILEQKADWARPESYYDRFLNRKCKNQKERLQWGIDNKDRKWRALYPYISEMCFYGNGLYYWD